MNVFEVNNLSKTYPGFKLKDINLKMKKGYIMGFIGENGAGKTTFLKCMLNLINRDSGEINIFGLNINDNEIDIKQDIAFMAGDASFYPRKRLSKITSVFKTFYKNWDDDIYQHYLEVFKLDENKKISELSQGMRIKYSIALALSHKAKLIILDEPTSGLDPVAREMLLDIFREIVEEGENSILFSTHITSDLEKCADYITFIRNGEIINSETKDDLLDSYKVISGNKNQLELIKDRLISYKTNSFGFKGLIKTNDTLNLLGYDLLPSTLDDIMVYFSTYGGNK